LAAACKYIVGLLRTASPPLAQPFGFGPVFSLLRPLRGGLAMLDALRPYLWLALAAFLVGVLSYVGLSAPSASAHPEQSTAAAAPVSGEWNLPKHI